MAIEVFNRFENKYLVSKEKFQLLQEKLCEHMVPDPYSEKNEIYSITNIYYDTDDNQLIRASLNKPKYKEKLRIRAYGKPNHDTKVYVEIKKKVFGLVNKRRSAMKLVDAYDFLATGALSELQPYMNKQVLNEIKYLLTQYNLSPKLYISYDRKAYFDKHNGDLRISFDTNIRTRRFDLKLESGMYGDLLLDEKTWLMEVKSSGSIPLWLAHLLSELAIYPTSFSKYGTEYKNSISA